MAPFLVTVLAGSRRTSHKSSSVSTAGLVTNGKRRIFLKGTAASSLITAAAASGLLRPTRVLAADWPKNAFAAKSAEAVIETLYGTSNAIQSDAIKVKAPVRAGNGAMVHISVSTTLSDVESIAIVVDKNPLPFVGRVSFTGAEPFISARIKVDETSAIRCLVRAGGKLYMRKQLIKVTMAG